MTLKKDYYVGIMSGTSMDAVESILCQIDQNQVNILQHTSLAFPSPLQSLLHQIVEDKAAPLQLLGEADIQLGELYAEATKSLLDAANITPANIAAIGCHGQTIYHSMDTHLPFSWQIGNPSIIAERTGITTIADFRMADIAAGGQGAPLAPAFHNAMFRSQNENRVIVNLGGIANLTLLPRESDKEVLGFDTGPANTLMDRWTHLHLGKHYDENGHWAKQGQVIEAILERALQHPYFEKGIPKSTGREDFNLSWLNSLLENQHYKAVDVQRTLLEISARSIAHGLTLLSSHADMEDVHLYACGGGTYNSFLIERIARCCNKPTIPSTLELGVAPDQVESAAFAWLAYRTLHKTTSNLPSVTGSHKHKVLGGVYVA